MIQDIMQGEQKEERNSFINVNTSVYRGKFLQVQLRLPEEMVREIDEWVDAGRFKSRSDAIRVILELYRDRERTIGFYRTLLERSTEAKERSEILIPLEEIE